MSKMLDALENKSVKKHVSAGLNIHDDIARTYFQVAKKKDINKKQKWISFLPWLITALVVIIAIAAVISKSSIDIKVRLLGEIPTLKNSQGAANSVKGVFLIKGGGPQADIVRNAYFAGDASALSYSKQEELVLCNTRGAGWANYTIELKEPLDLNKLDINYTAKGKGIGESVLLVIADSNNRIYRMEKDLSSALTGDWKTYTINFKPIKNALDLSNIMTIKFEFGSLTAGNYSNAFIYLKDIYLTKTRRLKWL
jgi:hypothetical protein